jgi:tetratricopeptide (TPR) repeat protein
MNRFIFFLLIIQPFYSYAQESKKEELLFQYAKKLQDEGKLNDALTIFGTLLKNDSSNVEYLQHASFLYSKIGHGITAEESKQGWYHTSEYLAKKALLINPKSADAHYVYALAIGVLSEKAGNRTKINNAKLIKTEAETALKLNPKLAGPYHILGRWHLVVAGFNIFERTMINAIFGKMPGGSYDEAISNFNKAIELEPANAIHYLQLAITYKERDREGDKAKALLNLNKAIKISPRNDDEIQTRKESEKLLLEMK